MARGESTAEPNILSLRAGPGGPPQGGLELAPGETVSGRELELITWAGRFSSWEGFQIQGRQESEITYDNMCYLREVFLGITQSEYRRSDWPLLARKVFEAQRQVGWRSYEPFLRWIKEERQEAESALSKLWDDDSLDPEARMQRFIEHLPAGLCELQPGARIGLASALMAANGRDWVPYQASIAKSTAKITGRPAARGASDCEVYFHYLKQLDRIVEGARELEYPIENRADARAALSWVIKGKEWLARGWGPAKDAWAEQTVAEFSAWRTTV